MCSDTKAKRGEHVLTGIALGANLGNREQQLNTAIEQLTALGSHVRTASFFETEPVGCPVGSPHFLNTVMVMEYSGELQQLFTRTQELEQQAGREDKSSGVRNAPRSLDLDILFYGDMVVAEDQLTLPHPRMMDRLFVLEPLQELLPDFKPYPDRPTVSERVKEIKCS